MFTRTVVQYASPSRPLPRQRIRAPLLASSPLLVLKHLPVTHPWASDGLVGPSSHSWSLCVDTLALFAGDRRARAPQGIASSTTKLVRRPVLPPTLHSCGSLSKSFGPSPSPSPLERLVLGLVVRVWCHPKRVRHPLLRGVHRPHVCVSHLDAVWYTPYSA
jgi:hypothetical protein